MDATNILCVFVHGPTKFENERLDREASHPLLMDGVNGFIWKKLGHYSASCQLPYVRPLFAAGTTQSEIIVFAGHVQNLMLHIPGDSSTVNLQPLLKLLFFDRFTELAFGRSANSLSPKTQSVVARRLPALLDEAVERLWGRYKLGKLLLLARSDEKWLELCAKMHAILDSLIDQEAEARRLTNPTKSSSDGILQKLLKTTRDKEYIRDDLFKYLLSADSMATLVGNVMFLLTRHPRVYQKLRATRLDSAALSQYVLRVIKETLRILSPVDIISKACISSCLIPHSSGPSGECPMVHKPGDKVELVLDLMHADPDLWGEDAEEFRPEHWGDSREADPRYLSFAAGPNTCPVQSQVLPDAIIFVTIIIKRYKSCENRDECVEYVPVKSC